MKFDKLTQILSEESPYKLNEYGEKLLQKYYKLISTLEDSIVPVIEPFVEDIDQVKKEIAIQIISTINSQELGTKEFEVASRLDTLTSGGRNTIDGDQFVFNEDDLILHYIDRVE